MACRPYWSSTAQETISTMSVPHLWYGQSIGYVTNLRDKCTRPNTLECQFARPRWLEITLSHTQEHLHANLSLNTSAAVHGKLLLPQLGFWNVAHGNLNGLIHSTNDVIGYRDIVAYNTIHRSWQLPFRIQEKRCLFRLVMNKRAQP